MKRRHALALGLAVLGPAHAEPAQRGQVVVWPEVDLLDGGRFGPARAAGRAVVVVFWTLDCPYCRRHLARMQQLSEAAAGLPLTVLGAAREADAAAVRRHVAEQRYTFAVTLDAAALGAALASRRVVPLTAVVGRGGRLKQVLPGEMAEDDVMELRQLARTEAPA